MAGPDRQRTHEASIQRAAHLLERVFHRMPLRNRVRAGVHMAVKTVLAALLAYAAGHLLHHAQAFWAAISAIAVMQPQFGDTRGAGHSRVTGTVFGGIAGLVGLAVGGSGDVLSFVVALALVTVACWTANAGAAARVGGITTAIILLVPAEGPHWEIALFRLGEVVIGTACALATGWAFERITSRRQAPRENA